MQASFYVTRHSAALRAGGGARSTKPASFAMIERSDPVADQTPKHLRIAADIRARIATGELQPGDKIESVKKLSDQ